MLNETELLLSGEPDDSIIDVGLMKIERGMAKIDQTLRMGQSIVDHRIKSNLTFAFFSELATAELEIREEAMLYIEEVNSVLSYIDGELDSSMNSTTFNQLIEGGTEKYLNEQESSPPN